MHLIRSCWAGIVEESAVKKPSIPPSNFWGSWRSSTLCPKKKKKPSCVSAWCTILANAMDLFGNLGIENEMHISWNCFNSCVCRSCHFIFISRPQRQFFFFKVRKHKKNDIFTMVFICLDLFICLDSFFGKHNCSEPSFSLNSKWWKEFGCVCQSFDFWDIQKVLLQRNNELRVKCQWEIGRLSVILFDPCQCFIFFIRTSGRAKGHKMPNPAIQAHLDWAVFWGAAEKWWEWHSVIGMV